GGWGGGGAWGERGKEERGGGVGAEGGGQVPGGAGGPRRGGDDDRRTFVPRFRPPARPAGLRRARRPLLRPDRHDGGRPADDEDAFRRLDEGGRRRGHERREAAERRPVAGRPARVLARVVPLAVALGVRPPGLGGRRVLRRAARRARQGRYVAPPDLDPPRRRRQGRPGLGGEGAGKALRREAGSLRGPHLPRPGTR